MAVDNWLKRYTGWALHCGAITKLGKDSVLDFCIFEISPQSSICFPLFHMVCRLLIFLHNFFSRAQVFGNIYICPCAIKSNNCSNNDVVLFVLISMSMKNNLGTRTFLGHSHLFSDITFKIRFVFKDKFVS
jgi:hypothetical protein